MKADLNHLPTPGSKPRYKLWVKYKPGFVEEGQPLIRVYYSYESISDPDYGLRRLLCLVKNKYNYIQLALLYDNMNKSIIKRFQA